jgi:cation diffusion facilitator family transporter
MPGKAKVPSKSYRPGDHDDREIHAQKLKRGSRRKVGAARISVASNTFLLVLKLSVGWMMGSVSVISEGLHSGMDLLAAVIATYSVSKTGKPADHDHAYGHGKYESLSGSVEALLIFVAALWIIYEAVKKIMFQETVGHLNWGMLVMLVSVLINVLVSKRLMTVAKEEDSLALEADALHLRTDVWTSAGVLIGLVLIYLTGYYILDPVIAIGVALLIIKAAYDLTKKSFEDLLDTRLPEEEEDAIRDVLRDHNNLFLEYHGLRTRKSGSERYIDLHIVFTKEMPMEEVHDVVSDIEKEIGKQLEMAHVMIHPEPCDIDCEECDHEITCGALREKILKSIDKKQKGVLRPLSDFEKRSIKRTTGRILKRDERVISFHKIRVLTLKGRISIKAHALVDPETPVKDGHKISHDTKAALDRIYPGCEVSLHFEPFGQHEKGHDEKGE